MSEQELNPMSVIDIFSQSQETFEDAKKKSDGEQNGKRAQHFRISKDGTYTIRILPLAPVLDKDGKVLPMVRKGYEYPSKNIVLKIKDKDSKGKEKQTYVGICHTKYAFPDLNCDLIDEFVSTVLDKYSSDEALCKKVKEGSFSGGLKWDSSRSMYIFDDEDRKAGIQLLSLSFSQYKDLEERKLDLWNKLNKKNKVPCPISSISDAYLVEIKRKTEAGKTSYSFNIDTIGDKDVLSEDELSALLSAPRLPEVIYRYTRYHLEATIVYLKQFCENAGISSVMENQRIIDAIDKIKMALPADDQSHFKIGGNNTQEGETSEEEAGKTLDQLWDMLDALVESGLSDRSEEGKDLRTSIQEYIEEHDLDVRVTRTKSNKDLLEEIEDAMETSPKEDRQEDAPEETAAETQEEDEDAPSADPEPAQEESPRTSRNDDTNEPAARTRRSARPERRR